jgi:hypothetical protein
MREIELERLESLLRPVAEHGPTDPDQALQALTAARFVAATAGVPPPDYVHELLEVAALLGWTAPPELVDLAARAVAALEPWAERVAEARGGVDESKQREELAELRRLLDSAG